MLNKQTQYCNIILSQKTDSRLDLAVMSTLIKALKKVYQLFKSQKNYTVMIIIKYNLSLKKKSKK